MAILTHGSEMTLAPTLRQAVKAADNTVRGGLARLAQLGFGQVQLDATIAGVRPRDLDKRARKDLIALLGRQGMRAGGMDLFIPRTHYRSAQHLDRAMSATLSAIELAADLGRLPMSLALPVRDLAPDVRDAMVQAADAHGVRLAVHAEDQLDDLTDWIEQVDLPLLGMALDPAAVLARDANPAELVQMHGKRLTVARLSDLAHQAGDDQAAVRMVVGQGELDLSAYRLSVDLATGRTGPVVLDLRGLANPLTAAGVASRQWDQAAFSV